MAECKNCKYCNKKAFNRGMWYCNNPEVSVFNLPVDTEKCFIERKEKKVRKYYGE